MLRLSIQKSENIHHGGQGCKKITFLGGVKNQAHIVDRCTKEINITRGRAIERAATENL